MLEIGLTGGIGSGKSTVASLLVQRGALLVDADAIVRELQEPGSPVFEAMVERWGQDIVAGDGTLDRQAVADLVFGDPDELLALNAIVHPAVGDEMTRRRDALAGTDATVVLDIPLLVESGHEGYGGIVVVDLDPEMSVQRLVEHRGFDEEDVRQRIARQVSRSDRLAKADFVVSNSGTPEDLEAEVDRCWAWIGTLERPQPGTPVRRIGSRAEKG